MSSMAGRDIRLEKSRTFARRALALGVASLPLFVAGFGWVPFAGVVALAAVVGSLIYGVLALRRPREGRSTAFAVIGLVSSLLTLLSFIYLILAFTTGPGD